MGWTNEQVEQLREMWSEGLTANEIAKKLGVTKNAIVGKVHRLCLKARPSPIKTKNADVKPETNLKQSDETGTSAEVAEQMPELPKVEVAVKEKKSCCEGNVKLTELDSHTCRWPIGDPRDDDFCFCGKRVRTGQTYCDEHSAMAYVKANRPR